MSNTLFAHPTECSKCGNTNLISQKIFRYGSKIASSSNLNSSNYLLDIETNCPYCGNIMYSNGLTNQAASQEKIKRSRFNMEGTD